MTAFGLLIDTPHWGYLKALTPLLMGHEVHLMFLVDGANFDPQNASKMELFLRLCAYEQGHYKQAEQLMIHCHFLRGNAPPEHPPTPTLNYFLPLPEHLAGSSGDLALELSEGQMNCLDQWAKLEIAETHLNTLAGSHTHNFETPNLAPFFEVLLKGDMLTPSQEHFLKDLHLCQYAWPFKSGHWLEKAYRTLLFEPEHQGAHLLLKCLGHSLDPSQYSDVITLLPPAHNTTCTVYWESQLPEAQLLERYEQLKAQSSTDWTLVMSYPNPSQGLQAALPEAIWNQDLSETAEWIMVFDDSTRLAPDHIAQHQAFIQEYPWVGLVLNTSQYAETQIGPLCLKAGLLHPLINLERALIHPLCGPGQFVRRSLWEEYADSTLLDIACLSRVSVGCLPDIKVQFDAPALNLLQICQRSIAAGQALKQLTSSPLSQWPALPVLEQTLQQHLNTFANTLHEGLARLPDLKAQSSLEFEHYVKAHQFWKKHAQALRPPRLTGSGQTHTEEILF